MKEHPAWPRLSRQTPDAPRRRAWPRLLFAPSAPFPLARWIGLALLVGCTAPLTVDRFDDEPSASACVEGVPDDCSLRGAILNANRAPGAATIVLPAGEFALSVPGRGEDDGEAGDLDIIDSVDITGPLTALGEPGAYVTAQWLDRAFHVHASSTGPVVALSGIAVTAGAPSEAPGGTADGGAVLVAGGAVRLEQCSVAGSDARRGGGVSNHAALTVIESTIGGNLAREAGGGVENAAGAALHLEKSTITLNRVDYLELGEGGGIWNAGELYVVESTLFDNTTQGASGGRGGAVFNRGVLAVANSSVVGNWAALGPFSAVSEGGGLYNAGAATVIHATFSDDFPDALWNGTGTIEIANSLISDASLVPIATPSCVGSGIDSAGGNLEVRGDTCGFDHPSDLVQVAEPVLGPLARNGGPTQTQALLAGSPAVDAGFGVGCLATDQRGEPRSDGHCDIGAFERRPGDP